LSSIRVAVQELDDALNAITILTQALPKLSPSAVSALPPTIQPATPPPTAKIVAYASGGLGLSAAAWEQQHGSPNHGSAVAALANYEQNKYIVAFWEGSVFTILRQTHGTTLPLATLKAEAHAMLPQDAKPLKTITEPNVLGGADNTVEMYTSPSLVARYPANPKIGPVSWGDVSPGTVSIIYDSVGESWSMAAGYSP
ncbi:MAG: hypothetical protein M3Z04_14160, partial [Chloroflexota bacterium]|nr:hypothetical protein [Chloroflexota bacterium]